MWVGAQEYIFSYRIVVRDGVIIKENYSITRAMVELDNKWVLFECEILPKESDLTIKEFFKLYQEAMLSCLFGRGIALREDGALQEYRSRSTTTLSIPPTRLLVEFKDDFATIKIIGEKP